MDIKVYALIDPRENKFNPRYIGVTGNYLVKRLNEHLRVNNPGNKNTHKENWIKLLKTNNIVPLIILIDNFPDYRDAFALEVNLIKYYRDHGYNLTNITNGGDGIPGYRHTDETKILMCEKRKHQTFSDETRAKLSAFQKGKFVSEETRERMRKGWEVRKQNSPPMSEEVRKKISDSVKKLWENEDYRNNVVNPLSGRESPRKGIPLTKEHREKLSLNHRCNKNKNNGN